MQLKKQQIFSISEIHSESAQTKNEVLEEKKIKGKIQSYLKDRDKERTGY